MGATVYLYPPDCLQSCLSSYPIHCLACYGAVVGCALYLLPSTKPAYVDPAGKAVFITGEIFTVGRVLTSVMPQKAILSLSPSLPCYHLKTTNENANSDTLNTVLSSFSYWHVRGFFIKTHTLKVDCYRTGKYTLCRRVRAYSSPEILQAGAVKGLMRLIILLLHSPPNRLF